MGHDQEDLTFCGGVSVDVKTHARDEERTADKCWTYVGGQWRKSHQLQIGRIGDGQSWRSPKGIMLFGGCCKPKGRRVCGPCGDKNVELLKNDGTTEIKFQLKQRHYFS